MQAINNITNVKAGVSRPPVHLARSIRFHRINRIVLRAAALSLLVFLAAPLSQSVSASTSVSVSVSTGVTVGNGGAVSPQLPTSVTPLTRPLDPVAGIQHTSLLGGGLALSVGQSVQGGFLQAYQKYGLSLIGYPLTPEINEAGWTVQYFERVRMEYHPELASKGTTVLFSRLGVQVSAGSSFGTVKPFSATGGRSYFDATGHSLAEPFLSFWRNNGGVALFGYPISETIQQDGMQVQWFERARMEYHPELASKGQPVQLTLLGNIAYSKAHNLPAQPPQVVPQVQLNGMESSLLAGINAQRSAAGAPPVSLTLELADFARSRSIDMASRNYFSHTTPEGKLSLDMLRGRGITYSLAGEILDKNNYADAQAVGVAVSNFMESPTHRAIMLDGRYTQVGVGYAADGNGMRYFTAVFIRK